MNTTLGGAAVANAKHGKLNVIGSNGLPVNKPLVRRDVNARACEFFSVHHIMRTSRCIIGEVFPLIGDLVFDDQIVVKREGKKSLARLQQCQQKHNGQRNESPCNNRIVLGILLKCMHRPLLTF